MKNAYTTGFKLRYKMGLLSPEQMALVPYKTGYNWMNASFAHLIGIESFDDDETRIKLIELSFKYDQLLVSFMFVTKSFLILIQILNSIENGKHQLFLRRDAIQRIVEEYKKSIDIKKIAKFWKLTENRLYTWQHWVEDCVHPQKEICKRKATNQISFEEQNIIKQYVLKPDFENWRISNIYYRMMEEGKAFMGIQTFRNYAKKFVEKKFPKNPKRIKRIGIRAKRPFEKLHMDVTIYRTLDNKRIYIYFVVDNFSRKILAWKASLEYKASISFENLEYVYHKYNLSKAETELIVDGGSENKAEVDTFILSKNNWRKLVAQKDILYSNSIVEAVNKIIKYHYLFKENLANLAELIEYLTFSVKDYNSRPHSSLKVSPNDAIIEKFFDNDYYKEKLKLSRRKRIEANKACSRCGIL